MLENVWPEVMDYLIERSGKSKGAFADACGISRKALSRYAKGRNRVESNFDKIAAGSGLTEGELGYVYAWFLMKRYRIHRFDLGIGSEVREPELAYDAPRALERGKALLRLDMNEVPAELAPPLALTRSELEVAVEDHQTAIETSERHLSKLVKLFEQLFYAARDLKRKLTRPR